MASVNTIVVAVALDRRDETTMRYAARVADLLHARAVIVAHVTPSSEEVASGVPTAANVEGTPEERLQRLIDHHRGRFPTATQVQPAVRRGRLVGELVRLSVERSADLLVLGRRPRDEHDAVSDAIVKLEWKSPCSILVVPDYSTPVFERILAPCDFSEHSREALECAIALAREARDAAIVVQHVFTLPPLAIMSGRSVADFAAIERERAEQQWREFSATIDFASVRHSLRFDESDSIPLAIRQAAADEDAQLIVVGSHGRTRAAGMLLGHVADAVCAATTRPFLCVKRKGEIVGLLETLLSMYRGT